MGRWVVVAVLCAAAVAWAEPRTVLRMATIAPDGTSWARELRAFAREVDDRTGGRVAMKIYFGGIAGDELEVGERIARGQLDGSVSGGALCRQLSPTMKVPSVQGIFQNRDEAIHVMTAMRSEIDDEFRRAGYTSLATASIGAVIVFTNTPVSTFEELRRLKMGYWHLDEIGLMMAPGIGIHAVPSKPETVNPFFEAHQIDGIETTPTVTLAWQLTPHLRYFLDLRVSYFYGCSVIANRSFDRMSVEDQGIIRAAAAKFRLRIEDVGRQQDDALLNGLFAQKGIQPLPVSAQLRSDFLVAARQAREALGEKLGVPAATLQRALALLADYRALAP